MKKIFKHFIWAVGALSLICACEKPVVSNEEEPGTEVEPTDLQIIESLVQVKSEGGEYGFSYVVTGEGFDVSKLKAEALDEWITGIDLTAEGEVKFTAEPNLTTESRISRVTLKYGKLSDKVTISQSGFSGGSIEAQFDIKYEINGPHVKMFVTPEPENIRYFAWYFNKKTMESALEKSPGVTIEMYLEKVIEVDLKNAIYYGGFAGYTPEQAVAELTFVGPSCQEFDLNGNTEFYGYVCAVTDTGELLSDVTITEFKTGPVEASDNVLTISPDDINTDRISYSVKTTNMDQYATLVLPAADVEGMSDDQVVEMFNQIPNYVGYIHFGDYSGTLLVNESDADYYILAFGYEYGMSTTDIHRLKVHTPAPDPSIIPEFSFNVNKVTHYRIKGAIEVSSNKSLYYVDCCSTDETAEDIKEMIHEAAQWYVDNGYYPNIAACMKIMGTKGNQSLEFTGLTGNTGYRMYAVGIDEVTGEFTTDVCFSEVITTPAKKVSKSPIDIQIGKYFDGLDLAAAYPQEFGDAEGWAVLPLEVSKTGDVVDYYYDVYVGDVTDTTYPTDEEIILDLEQYGKANIPLTMSYCYFYEELTLIYFSKDSDDNNSEVKRIKFSMTPEGCAPVSEFDYLGNSQPTMMKSPRKFNE